MDYWQAALKTAWSHPLFGTGPGTFLIPYQAIKRPESELARLVHNDYLEQASDSGFLGFFSYAAFIVLGLLWIFRQTLVIRQLRIKELQGNPTQKPAVDDGENYWLVFCVWLGLVGWVLQSLIEFPLYLPGSAWPAFSFFGWLVQRASKARIWSINRTTVTLS